MTLPELMCRLSEFGYVQAGHGPKHPIAPRPQLQTEVDEFFVTYPRLELDQGYVDFLERYAAVSVQWPDDQLFIDIFGFDENLTVHVLCPDEPLSTDDGLFGFAVVTFSIYVVHSVSVAYAFALSEEKRTGIYQRIFNSMEHTLENRPPFQWYCGTFLEWLERLCDTRGHQY